MARGQLSAEALLVFLVFLLLAGISYFATAKLGAGAQNSVENSLSRNSFNSMASAIDQSCMLGSGNIREVNVRGGAATIASDGKRFNFSAKSFFAAANSSCEIEVLQGGASDFFRVENDQGTIKIS